MRALARIVHGLIPALLLCACFGDDDSGQPPPPGPPPAPATAAPDATAAAASDGVAVAAAPDTAAPTPPSRAPTAADMLGLGRRDLTGKSRLALPPFLQGGLPEGQENPLFKGQPVQPSTEYAALKTNPIDVSPIERHWGADEELRGGGAPGQRGLSAPRPSNVESVFGTASKPTAVAGVEGSAATSEAKFRVTLYRLNAQTGQVETFDRAYTTAEARDAAREFKAKEGFKPERPAQKDVDAVAAAAKALREAGDKKEGVNDPACKFRATWSTGEGSSRETHSRCFNTQGEVDRFTAERGRNPNGAGATAPEKEAPKERPEDKSDEKPAEDPGALKPEPIGTP